MSDSSERAWSDSPNAPKIPYSLYIKEKTGFTGMLAASILYGVLIVLFFQCMAALFNPVNRKLEGIKWGFVSYTVAAFSSVTILNGMAFHVEFLSYINNRESPGVEGIIPPGPSGYPLSIWTEALSIIPRLMFLLNNWLADGLLIYRCYIIYSTNFWAIAFPCFMYLASFVMGMLTICTTREWVTNNLWSSIACLSISLSLNVLLTLMIIIRLVLHSRDVRATLGAPLDGISGLYKRIITMLVESCALFAVSSLLVIGLLVAGNPAVNVFLPILVEIQVISPLLIIRRVANRRALTSNTITPRTISSFRARSQTESTSTNYASSDGHPIGSVDKYRSWSDQLGVGVETTVDLRRDSEA